MNTVATVQAWLALAPQLAQLILMLEALFPHRNAPTGPAKLSALNAVTGAAVSQTVQGVDHATLSALNSAFAAEATQAPLSAKTVQEIA